MRALRVLRSSCLELLAGAAFSDPFDPSRALFVSAHWLRELWVEFGNFGLAAAAYNAGPQQVRNWMKGQDMLPAETRAYVMIVTGHPAMYWAGWRRIARHQAPRQPT